MANRSKIEWTETTWNPVTGCSKISTGCAHCYAERMSKRLKAMGQPNYINGFQVTTHIDMLNRPMKWKKPQIVFVNSMSDLFHEDVPFPFIENVFQVMQQASHHIFQVLTKRSERLADIASKLPWPENVWMGVTVENQDNTYRMEALRKIPAAVRFVSFEPLLGPINDPDFTSIDWAIVGGESGPGARVMKPEWVLKILEKCREYDVPFFFKQWGGQNRKKNGRLLQGNTYDEMPGEIKQHTAQLAKSA